jgi:hypothetical protein
MHNDFASTTSVANARGYSLQYLMRQWIVSVQSAIPTARHLHV